MIKALGVSNKNLGVSDEMNVGHGPWGSPLRGVFECIKFLPGLLSAMNFIISYHILPYLILSRPRITWLKDGIELASFSEHEHVTLLKF